GGLVHGMVFSADSRLLAAASGDTLAYLWDLQTGRKRTFSGHRNEIRDVALSPDGTKLATVSTDGMLRVFDVDAEHPFLKIRAHEPGAGKVVFLRDDHIVTAGRDRFVRWWMLDPDDVRAEIERLRR
ncbi:MAG: WD40 repeat domain-containing protein, partial [Planctomycetota bacterium]